MTDKSAARTQHPQTSHFRGPPIDWHDTKTFTDAVTGVCVRIQAHDSGISRRFRWSVGRVTPRGNFTPFFVTLTQRRHGRATLRNASIAQAMAELVIQAEEWILEHSR